MISKKANVDEKFIVECLGCGKDLNRHTGVGYSGKPKPGDYSVCLYCGSEAIFDQNIKLRHLTENERIELHNSREMMMAQTVLDSFKKILG